MSKERNTDMDNKKKYEEALPGDRNPEFNKRKSIKR